MGLMIIIGFLTSFLQFRSPLDLLFITIGLMMIITGFRRYGEKINKSLTYFGPMFAINVFQWLIVIYTLLFAQIYLSGDYLVVMAIAPIMTISLTFQFLKKSMYSEEDIKSDDNSFSDKTRVLLIVIGFILILVFWGGFLFSRSPLDLFAGSLGLMFVILGFHYGMNAGISFNNSKTENNLYSGMNEYLLKNIKVTPNYFWAVLGVLIFQWLISYIVFIYPSHVRDEIDALPMAFAMMATLYFFIQIRESDLKYIGKMRTGKRRRINYNLIMILAFASSVLILIMPVFLVKTSYEFVPFLIVSVSLFIIGVFLGIWKIIRALNGDKFEIEIKDNGYLVCNKCNRYYELQVDESPEDFSDQCECGGKLQYNDSI